MKDTFIISKVTILSILIFITQFISLPYFSWYNMVRYGTVIIVGIYVFIRYRYIIQKKYLSINLLAVLFGGLTVGLSFINRNTITERNPFLASIVFVALFLTFLFFMEIVVEQGKVQQALETFYKVAWIIVIITDFLILIYPELHLVYEENYFVGTKFEVVYLHFFLIVLCLEKKFYNCDEKGCKVYLLVLLAVTLFIGIQVDCSTGIVGVLIFLVLILLINKREKQFLNPVFYLIIQFLCFTFVFFCEYILSNSAIESFIVDVLGKSITMTGRVNIYKIVLALLFKYNAWNTGFGYATSYELGGKHGNFPNTQNGILEWIWQVGIPTTIVMVAMFMLMLFVSKKYLNDSNRKLLYPLLVGLYLMTILGMVEITISQMYFAFAICIIGVAMGLGKKTKRNT